MCLSESLLGEEKEKSEKEVRVPPPPSYRVVAGDETNRIEREKSLEEERVEVIGIARRVSVFFVGLMVTTGTLLTAFSIMVMTGNMQIPLEGSFLALALAILGTVNIISGLLLMARS